MDEVLTDYPFRLAVNMAKKSPSRFRLGAVLVKRNKIISAGFNMMHKTHTLMQRYNMDKSWTPGLHAEIHACIGVPMADLEGASLYVVRILKDGSLAMSKPCLICQRFIADVGISNVFYVERNGEYKELYGRP